jgi:5-oxoprolinase (ATP-hydrolysing) subunit A
MRSSADRSIDLNADVGEGAGEEPLYASITSANIACGGHAGDLSSMREAVRLAMAHGVAIGAHPSYPDREGFGRVTKSLAPAELARAIAGQVAALVAITEALGTRVTHVKPHGALYNDAASRSDVALAVADGVASVSHGPVLVGLAGSSALRVWRDRGFRVAAEGFADRAYAAGGTLVPRTRAFAVITDPEAATAQAIGLAGGGGCATICVHADTPGAALIAAAVRLGLEQAGFVVSALYSRAPES